MGSSLSATNERNNEKQTANSKSNINDTISASVQKLNPNRPSRSQTKSIISNKSFSVGGMQSSGTVWLSAISSSSSLSNTKTTKSGDHRDDRRPLTATATTSLSTCYRGPKIKLPSNTVFQQRQKFLAKKKKSENKSLQNVHKRLGDELKGNMRSCHGARNGCVSMVKMIKERPPPRQQYHRMPPPKATKMRQNNVSLSQKSKKTATSKYLKSYHPTTSSLYSSLIKLPSAYGNKSKRLHKSKETF